MRGTESDRAVHISREHNKETDAWARNGSRGKRKRGRMK